MADINYINIGFTPNDGQGDPIRDSFQKINENFDSVLAELANVQVEVNGATNVGAPQSIGLFKDVNNKILEFKRLNAGTGIQIFDYGDEVSIVNTQALNLLGQPGSFVVTINNSGSLGTTDIIKYDQVNDALQVKTDISAEYNKIVNLSNPISSQDAATKSYVDSAFSASGGGIIILDNNTDLGLQRRINFIGSGISIQNAGVNTISISVEQSGTNVNEVKDVVGNMFTNTLNYGIVPKYSSISQKVNFGIDGFDIRLTGDITGIASVNTLASDIIINTTANTLKSVKLLANNTDLGNIKAFNFTGDAVSVRRDDEEAIVSINYPTVKAEDITSLLNPSVIGQHNGLTVNYNQESKKYKYQLNPISFNLAGAVAGSGTLLFDQSANSSTLTINTVRSAGILGIKLAGIEKGSASTLNIIPGGVTPGVKVSGDVATVYIPKSVSSEEFVTVNANIQNTPNARNLTAGSGITIIDHGPGGNIVVSAAGNEILSKSAYELNGETVAEQLGINIIPSQYIKPVLVNDVANNRVNLTVYHLKESWFRSDYDAGSLTDNQGPIVDLGKLTGGIIESVADLGTIS